MDQPEAMPVRHCGARVCGMHPAHRYVGDDGQSAVCPGSHAG